MPRCIHCAMMRVPLHKPLANMIVSYEYWRQRRGNAIPMACSLALTVMMRAPCWFPGNKRHGPRNAWKRLRPQTTALGFHRGLAPVVSARGRKFEGAARDNKRTRLARMMKMARCNRLTASSLSNVTKYGPAQNVAQGYGPGQTLVRGSGPGHTLLRRCGPGHTLA